MSESFQQFDQHLDTGWRTLRVKRDYAGAAEAILQYQSLHAAGLNEGQKGSLAFHLAGVYALAGDKAKAIEWFQKSLDTGGSGNPAYIQGFIHFLQGDKTGLADARHTIATTNPGPWREQDLKEMDAMLAYFGEPFEAAWGALNCHDPGIKGSGPEWIAYCQADDAKYRKIYLEHGIKLTTR
ncbi:MAG TPA: hypothetical protein VGH91_05000 [Gammaproteobacteria bacterium]|jgi:hypothetical protein